MDALDRPAVRLALRAALAGLTVFVTQYTDNGVEAQAAMVAGVLAAAELLTPLNPHVGVLKGSTDA